MYFRSVCCQLQLEDGCPSNPVGEDQEAVEVGPALGEERGGGREAGERLQGPGQSTVSLSMSEDGSKLLL